MYYYGKSWLFFHGPANPPINSLFLWNYLVLLTILRINVPLLIEAGLHLSDVGPFLSACFLHQDATEALSLDKLFTFFFKLSLKTPRTPISFSVPGSR